jgi:hypothetical protein
VALTVESGAERSGAVCMMCACVHLIRSQECCSQQRQPAKGSPSQQSDGIVSCQQAIFSYNIACTRD